VELIVGVSICSILATKIDDGGGPRLADFVELPDRRGVFSSIVKILFSMIRFFS
jgi:hypothetical protein